MKEYTTQEIRNIALIGHGNSGKTSLTSAILFDAGVGNRLTKVDQGNTITDFEQEEIDRKITISTGIAHIDWKKIKINILDTPGYGNFLWDAQAALRVVEGALVLVDASSGVEVQTEKAWKYASDYNVSRIIVVNKIDRDRANFDKAVESIQEVFGRGCIPIQLPIGEESNFKGIINLIDMKAYIYQTDESGKFQTTDIPADLKEKAEEKRMEMVEMIAEQDEDILNKYLEEGDLSNDDIIKGLKEGVKNGELFPIVISSAIMNIGIHPILDLVVAIVPNPAEIGEIKAKKGDEEVSVKVDSSEPFSAFVFKTLSDPYAGRINIMKIYSGQLTPDKTVLNTVKEKEEKIANLVLLLGKEQTPVDKVNAGDIVATLKLKETLTNDTLSDPKNPIVFEPIKFSEASISFALEPKTRQDEDKLSTSLTRIGEEDPTIKYKRDAQTKELVISGNGQLHIEVIVSKLKKRFGVDVLLKPPKIPYLETIKGKADIESKYKKQTGGRGQYGHVKIKLEPLPRGKDFEFVDDIFGGAIPKNYIPSVEKGIQEARQKGIIAGYPVVDFKVVLYDGSYHEVDSSDMAFKIAASMAFKKGVKDAKPTILEPIMNVEIYAPEDQLGDVMGNLNGRRGKPLGTEQRGKMSIIKAQVPLAEMLDFEPTLTSITGGRGSYTMEFSHYEEVPAQIQQKIIEQAKKEGRIQDEEN